MTGPLRVTVADLVGGHRAPPARARRAAGGGPGGDRDAAPGGLVQRHRPLPGAARYHDQHAARAERGPAPRHPPLRRAAPGDPDARRRRRERRRGGQRAARHRARRPHRRVGRRRGSARGPSTTSTCTATCATWCGSIRTGRSASGCATSSRPGRRARSLWRRARAVDPAAACAGGRASSARRWRGRGRPRGGPGVGGFRGSARRARRPGRARLEAGAATLAEVTARVLPRAARDRPVRRRRARRRRAGALRPSRRRARAAVGRRSWTGSRSRTGPSSGEANRDGLRLRSRLEAAIADEHFPEVDLALRRGRHVGRDDGAGYDYLVDAQDAPRAVLPPLRLRAGPAERRLLLPARRPATGSAAASSRRARCSSARRWRCSTSTRRRSSTAGSYAGRLLLAASVRADRPRTSWSAR